MTARIVLAILVLVPTLAAAQSRQELFHIERSKNRNVVRYDANIGKDGRLDPKAPVVSYWLGPDGRRWEVNLVDRTFFYGFKVRKSKDGESWTLTIAAAKNRPMRVYLKDGQAHAEGLINGAASFLQALYVKFAENTTIPSVSYVDLIGVDAKTGTPRRERVVP